VRFLTTKYSGTPQFFKKITKHQVKLIYTYSHSNFFQKSTNNTLLTTLVRGVAHEQWVQNSKPLINPRLPLLLNPYSNVQSRVSTYQLPNNLFMGTYSWLYLTTISYNTNKLQCLTLVHSKPDFTPVIEIQTIGLFLQYIQYIHLFVQGTGFNYMLNFTDQNSKLWALFMVTPSQLISTNSSRPILLTTTTNLRYL
jgi:hypothetical protein